MSSLFFHLGRRLGLATIPAIRKSKSAWLQLTGTETHDLDGENKFGEALAAEIRLRSGVSRNPEDLRLIREIGQNISARVRNKILTFKINLLQDEVSTALALPGGFIFVSHGLLVFCGRDRDELAFVIGHEMGHVVRGHALERMLSRIGAEGLSSIVSRGLLNPGFRETGLNWLESSHAPAAELEADEFGIRAALAAGYDSAGAVRFLTKLASLRLTPELMGNYFASHPLEPERITRIKEIVRSLPGK